MKLGPIASNDSTLTVFVQCLAQFFHHQNFSEEAASCVITVTSGMYDIKHLD